MMICATTWLAAAIVLQSPRGSELGRGVPAAASTLKAGDLVRVNYLGAGDVPSAVGVYPSLDHVRAVAREFAESARANRLPSVEGLVQVGHNTPARVEKVSGIEVSGREIRYAQVTLGAGLLRGQRLWVRADRLRDAREPDPARKAAREGESLAGAMLPIDPLYEARAGDRVVIACYDGLALADIRRQDRGDSGDDAVMSEIVPMLPSRSAVQKQQEDIKAGRPGEPGGFGAATSGTAAVVEEATSPFLKVRISGGPFDGQSWYVLKPFVCRPAAFAEARARPAPSMLELASVAAGEPEEPAKAPRRRRVEEPSPSGDLALTDLAVNENAALGWFTISGRIRNTSGSPLKSILVDVAVEDRGGRMIRSATVACTPSTIDAGGTGSFTALAERDAAAAGVTLDFKTFERAIPWVDRSGKRAHR